MAISMLKIRRSLGRLIFNMGIAIPGKTVFLIETAPCFWNIYAFTTTVLSGCVPVIWKQLPTNIWIANYKSYVMPLLTSHLHNVIDILSTITLVFGDKFLAYPPGENGRHFTGDVLRSIFMNENFEFWLKFHWRLFLMVQLTIRQHQIK